MSDVTLFIDGVPRRVPSDVTVAVAILNHGTMSLRKSSEGQPRAPVCAMGTCFECRVTVDGQAGVRACITPVTEGMQVETMS